MKLQMIVICMLLTSGVHAWDKNPSGSRGQGYVFVAGVITPGGSGTIHAGVGGEGFVYRGLGIGAEVGFRGRPDRDFGDSVHGVGLLNISYHFFPKTSGRKREPFVTAGYAVAVRAGVVHGTNFGAGVNIWLRRDMALRCEVRDIVILGGHQIGFRIGATFR